MSLSKGKTQTLERLRNPKLRVREGLFLVEGVRGVRELTQATLPLRIRFAVVSPRLSASHRGSEVLAALNASGTPVEEVADRELDPFSDTAAPQGVLAVVEEPEFSLAYLLERDHRPRLLVLDGIQDPGNAGTLIRAARAFGLTGVVALDGTVDPFNAKVVRSSAGSLAHIPVVRAGWPETCAWLSSGGVPLLVADAQGEGVRTRQMESPWALAVGNEGAGCRGGVLQASKGLLGVPMAPGVDSLNAAVAGAILLFALSGFSSREGDQ